MTTRRLKLPPLVTAATTRTNTVATADAMMNAATTIIPAGACYEQISHLVHSHAAWFDEDTCSHGAVDTPTQYHSS